MSTSYDRTFTDRQGGTQRLRAGSSGTVTIEGTAFQGSRGAVPVAWAFDAEKFSSAALTPEDGRVTVRTSDGVLDMDFDAMRGIGFGLDDLLEAVASAREGS